MTLPANFPSNGSCGCSSAPPRPGVALCAGAVVVYESRTFRPRAPGSVATPANIIGEVIQSALDFGDPEAARRYLQNVASAGGNCAGSGL